MKPQIVLLSYIYIYVYTYIYIYICLNCAFVCVSPSLAHGRRQTVVLGSVFQIVVLGSVFQSLVLGSVFGGGSGGRKRESLCVCALWAYFSQSVATHV